MTKANKKSFYIIFIAFITICIIFSSILFTACGEKPGEEEEVAEVEYTIINSLKNIPQNYMAIVVNFKNNTEETKNFSCVEIFINNVNHPNLDKAKSYCQRFYTDTTTSAPYISFSLEANQDKTVILTFTNVSYVGNDVFDLYCKGEKVANVNL